MSKKIKSIIFFILGALLFCYGVVNLTWAEYNRVEISELRYIVDNFRTLATGALSTMLGAWFLILGFRK